MIKIIPARPEDGEEPIKKAETDEDVEPEEETDEDETDEDVYPDEDETDEEDRYCGCMGGRRSASAQATPVPLYFELLAEERPPDDQIAQEEVYCAMSINRGQRLVLTPYEHHSGEAPAPSVDFNFVVADAGEGRLDEPEDYCDSISDILQAAEAAGLNPDDLCRRAVESQRRERRDAAAGARRTRQPR